MIARGHCRFFDRQDQAGRQENEDVGDADTMK